MPSWADVMGGLTSGPNGGFMDDGLGGLTTRPDEEDDTVDPKTGKKKFDFRKFLTPQQGQQQGGEQPSLAESAGGATGRAIMDLLKFL